MEAYDKARTPFSKVKVLVSLSAYLSILSIIFLVIVKNISYFFNRPWFWLLKVITLN